MLKTKFKASKIANLTDARYFAAWDVDYIGFDMVSGSETKISFNEFYAMNDWIEGPQSVIEIGSFPEEKTIELVINDSKIKYVEIGMFCSMDIINKFIKADKNLFFHFIFSKDLNLELTIENFEKSKNIIDHYVFDLHLLEDNWKEKKYTDFIQKIAKEHSVFLDGNFSKNEIEKLITWNITGFSAKGGEEEKVGYKSFDELDEIFEALEIFE